MGLLERLYVRLGERPNALTCCAVRDCTGINPATLSHHMKKFEIAVRWVASRSPHPLAASP
jgi:hypothetical protein